MSKPYPHIITLLILGTLAAFLSRPLSKWHAGYYPLERRVDALTLEVEALKRSVAERSKGLPVEPTPPPPIERDEQE